MPYKDVKELPESVQNALPEHAKEIYQEAFNSAWDQYARPESRKGNATREETAHKVAWAAVKKTYEKNEKSGRWEKKRD